MWWVVNATPRPLYPQGNRPSIHSIVGWVGPRAGLEGCGTSHLPTGIRSSDHPSRSESLYRLSYPGPVIVRGYVSKRRSVCRTYFLFSLRHTVYPLLVSVKNICVPVQHNGTVQHSTVQYNCIFELVYCCILGGT
jgi:hypothetical protein